MTRLIEVDGTPSERPIDGAAVVTIVPSSISMKKQPATSNASLRSRGTDRTNPIEGNLLRSRGSETQLEFPRPQRRGSESQKVGLAGDEPDFDQALDRLVDRRQPLRGVLDRGQLAPHRRLREPIGVCVDQRGEDHRFDVSLTLDRLHRAWTLSYGARRM